MKAREFAVAVQPVEETPAQPEPPQQGNVDRLLERIRAKRPDLLSRPSFALLHQRGCASTKDAGALCDCDAVAVVDGHVVRLRN